MYKILYFLLVFSNLNGCICVVFFFQFDQREHLIVLEQQMVLS